MYLHILVLKPKVSNQRFAFENDVKEISIVELTLQHNSLRTEERPVSNWFCLIQVSKNKTTH